MAAPVWRTRIVYFAATGAGAAVNQNDGVWITAVASDAAGQAYVRDAANQARAVEQYGAGELRSLSAPIDIPADAIPHHGWYDEDAGTLSTNRVVQFTLRGGIQAFHDRMHELAAIEREVGPDYSDFTRLIVRRTLHGLHQGMFLTYSQLLVEKNTITAAQIGEILRLSSLGPNDAVGGVQVYDPDNPRTIVPLIAKWREARLLARDTEAQLVAKATRPHTVPRIIVSFAANPAVVGIQRRSFAAMMEENMLDQAGVLDLENPTDSQLAEGAWIERINA